MAFVLRPAHPDDGRSAAVRQLRDEPARLGVGAVLLGEMNEFQVLGGTHRLVDARVLQNGDGKRDNALLQDINQRSERLDAIQLTNVPVHPVIQATSESRAAVTILLLFK